MSFLFGWQSSDLGPTTVKNRTGPNAMFNFEPDGGFIVPEDCTAKRIYVDIQDSSASDVFKLGLLDKATNQIIAKSAEYSVSVGGFFVDIPHTQLTQGQAIGIVFHTNGYIQANVETAVYRYFDYQSIAYVDGMPDTFTKNGSTNTGRSEIWVDGDIVTSASIGDVDGDNSVTQSQLVNINGVADFGGPITSGTLGGQPLTIVDGDWQSNGGVVSANVPSNLSTGTYQLELSDGTLSATLDSISYTKTHDILAPFYMIDSNSVFFDQEYDEGTYSKVLTQPSNGFLDIQKANSQGLWGNDISDIYTPNFGYTGLDSFTMQELYPDGTLGLVRTITISVDDGSVTPPEPTPKGLNVRLIKQAKKRIKVTIIRGIIK